MSHSGGCQCGAVRFRVEEDGLGRGSICHCRMCQKAFGGFYGPLITAHDDKLTWTRGEPAYFQSSNIVRRGFCKACGTPLTYMHTQGMTELAIGAFDDPEAVKPAAQLSRKARVSYVDELPALPAKDLSARPGMVSYQHPDHDTDHWPE